MANKSINTLSRPLSDVLSKPADVSNIKLLDILVDTAEYDESTDIQGQSNSSFLYEISFNVDIESVVRTEVEGYQLKIINPITGQILSSAEDRNYTCRAFFAEDFPDSVNTGENDFDTVIRKIREVQTVLVSEDLADEGRIEAPTITSDAYDSLAESSSTGILGTGMRGGSTYASSYLEVLASGEDPSEEAALTMPAFALSRSSLFDSLTNDEQSPITYAFSMPRAGKTSLSSMRSEIKSKKKTRSKLGYRVENQIIQGPTSGVSTILGKNCQIQNSLFKCIRRIEVPKSFVIDDPQTLTFIFQPITTKNDRAGPAFEGIETPRPTELVHQFAAASLNLLIPEIPPEIEVINSSRGQVTYRVSRGDPSTKQVAILNKVYNGLVGRIEFESTDFVNFNEVGINHKIVHTTCKNFEPYIVSLVAIAINSLDNSVSSTKVLSSFPTQECRQGFKTNNVAITAVNTSEGILVRSDLNGTKPTKMCLYREDFSLGLYSPSKVVKLQEISPVPSFIEFLDTSTFPNREYKYYTVQTMTEPGSNIYEEMMSSDYEVIKRKQSPKSSLYKVSIERVDRGTISRSFIPRVSVQEDEFIKLVSALRASPNSSEIMRRLESQLEPLIYESLPIFKVERINRDDGTREFIGTAEPDKVFEDNEPISMTSSISYVFKLCVFDPSSIKSFSENFYEDSPTSKRYVMNKIMELTGVIPTDYEKITLEHLETGNDTVINQSRGTQTSFIDNLAHTIINEGFNFGATSLKLSWSVPLSQALSTDGFFVVCRYQGMETIVGTIPANPLKTNNYSFIESEFVNEVGTKEYYVLSRFVDLNISQPSNIVSLTKHTSVPDDVMRLSRLSQRSGDRSNFKSLSALQISDAFRGRG